MKGVKYFPNYETAIEFLRGLGGQVAEPELYKSLYAYETAEKIYSIVVLFDNITIRYRSKSAQKGAEGNALTMTEYDAITATLKAA